MFLKLPMALISEEFSLNTNLPKSTPSEAAVTRAPSGFGLPVVSSMVCLARKTERSAAFSFGWLAISTSTCVPNGGASPSLFASVTSMLYEHPLTSSPFSPTLASIK